MSKFKKYLSYFWDIPIERSSSKQNELLEVVWSMGRKVLNSRNANYSFGNGYKVFEYAFSKLGLSEVKSVLVLGFGAGSVEHLINKVYNLDPQITGIEYDAEIIRLYRDHFSMGAKNEVLHCDALQFLEQNTNVYDLIIVDLFDDLKTVPIIYNDRFTEVILQSVSERGLLIYNTVESEEDKSLRFDLLSALSKRFRSVEVLEFQDINRIIIAQ